jgi:hypothetical protein
MSKNKLSYSDAVEIALKGTYYPQETNHAGMPLRKVTCDYCGKDKLGSSWKISLDHDLCMNCYVKLQVQNGVNNGNANIQSSSPKQSTNMPASFNQGFNNDFFKSNGLDWLLTQDWNFNGNNNTRTQSNSMQPNSSTINYQSNTRNAGDIRNNIGASNSTRSLGYANNTSAWSQNDNPNSYANRIITEDDDWRGNTNNIAHNSEPKQVNGRSVGRPKASKNKN